ncbi:MAG TPA: trehalase family glycosidase [Acidobacteriaceae bacterium]|nr:trehalase family glycosidase [Acidobacteriaceae bacterium]
MTWAVLMAAMMAGAAAGAQEAGRVTASPQSGKPALQPVPSAKLGIDAYIHEAWTTLQRSMTECTTLVDPKLRTKPVLYLPQDFAEPPEVAALGTKCGVRIERLPVKIEELGQKVDLKQEGLLYLPHPYVVPGGRFNEMYGWDSYFILLGLLEDGRVDLARGMVENFFFEIEHYGGLLNANRTYYLTRSQPPFLSSMIRDIYDAEMARGHKAEARAWLERAYPLAEKDYSLWTREAHRAGDTGLARYYDYGAGPVPEMADDDAYYQNVIQWLLAHPGQGGAYLVEGPATLATAADRERVEAVSCDPEVSVVCARAHVGTHWLTKDFYKGDRAMRESGFDPSFRWGVFDGSTHHYAAVGLNALLYKYGRDLAWMAGQVGKPDEARRWEAAAAARRAAMNKYLWNEAKGMYFDYDYQTGQQSTYNYLTTFYPLFGGSASAEQAQRVEASFGLFNHKGGLAMSTTDTGVQWDLPYGWAPATWVVVDGMKEAGDIKDAGLVSQEFTATIRDNFACEHTIREKYNVVTGSAEVAVATGYRQNVVGFGWTNAVFLKMNSLLQSAGIPESKAGRVRPMCGTEKPAN